MTHCVHFSDGYKARVQSGRNGAVKWNLSPLRMDPLLRSSLAPADLTFTAALLPLRCI